MMKRTGMKLVLMAMLVVGMSVTGCILEPIDGGSTEDTIAPTVSIEDPVNNAAVPTNFGVIGTMQDQQTGIASVYISIDGDAFTAVPNSRHEAKSESYWTNNNISHIVESNVVIAVYAKDLKGNISTTNTITVHVVSGTVADTTAPSWSVNPEAADIQTNSFDITATIDEDGTIYYGVWSDGASGQTVSNVMNGDGALTNGSISATGATSATIDDITFSGIAENTAYDVYLFAADDETTPNMMASTVKVDVTTTYGIDTITDVRSEFSGLTNLQITNSDNYIDVYVTWIENQFVYLQEDADGGPGIGALDTGLEDTVSRGDRILIHVTNIQQYWDMESVYGCELISNISSGNTITAVDVLPTRDLTNSDEAVWVKLDGVVQAKDNTSYTGLSLITISNGQNVGTLKTTGTIYDTIDVGDEVTAEGPVWVYDETVPVLYADMSNNTYITVTPDPGPTVEIVSPTNGEALVINDFDEIGWVFDSRSPILRVDVKVEGASTWTSIASGAYDTSAGTTNYWTNSIVDLTYGVRDLYARAMNIYSNWSDVVTNEVIVPDDENNTANNSYSTPDSLILTAPIYGRVDPASDEDWFIISLDSTKSYTVNVEPSDRTGESTTVDCKLAVHPATGYPNSAVTSDLNSGTGNYPMVSGWSPSTTAQYLIRVALEVGSAGGFYKITVSEE